MATKSLDILMFTSETFSEEVLALLGRGKAQALALYHEYFTKGSYFGNDPCFDNAQLLKEAMVQAVDWPTLKPYQITQEKETIKFTLKLADGYETESVIIPMQAGPTLCVSSQIGCRMGCRFCETGRLGLLRNLTVGEITAQLAIAKFHFGAPIRSIVFMGMGEPMDNLDAVIGAIEIFSDPRGFNIGRRHITVSTSGHLEGLERFEALMNPPVNLAVSVIAPTDEIRTRLMPVNRKWNMAKLYDFMKRYNERSLRQVLVEYVLLENINDSPENAEQLAKYVKGLDVKINLIPYNAQSSSTATRLGPLGSKEAITFKPSSETNIDLFAEKLRSFGLRTLIRKRKGHDIMAACGQLGNLKWRKNSLSQV